MKFYDCEERVIYGDTDAMGIVYHTNFVKWFEKGRTEYLRQIGFPYVELDKKGVWLPVAEVHCCYKKPARYDDVLTIRTGVKSLKSVTVVMAYEIVNKSTGELLVTGTTKHGMTTPQLKPIRLKKELPQLYARIAEDL